MKKITKILPGLLIGLAIFASFWQTRLIIRPGVIDGGYNEYLTLSLYGSHIIWIAALLSYIFLAKRKPARISSVWEAWLLFLAIAWPFLSLVWSADPVLGLFKYFYLSVAIAAGWILSGSSYRWDKAFIWSLVPVSMLGIWQFFSQSAFACKYLGLASKSSAALAGESVIETASGRWLRAYGSFDHPNIFGAVLLCGLILSISYILSRRLDGFKKYAYYSVATIFSIGIFLSFSRIAWAGFALSMIAFGYDSWRRRKHGAWHSFVVLAALLAVSVGPLAWQERDLWLTRLDASTRLEKRSVSERIRYGTEANNIISDHWLIGAGLGQYIAVLSNGSKDLSIRSAWDYQPVHDLPRLIWSEIGLVGLLLSCAAISVIWKRFDLPSSLMLSSLGIAGLLDHWLFSLSFGMLFSCIIFGLAINRYKNNQSLWT